MFLNSIIASCSLGAGYAALKATIQYATDRKQFQQPLSSFQHIQFKLSDMATNLNASRLLVRHAAQIYDQRLTESNSDLITSFCAMSKIFATEKCFDVI